jgi:hypothetical protein
MSTLSTTVETTVTEEVKLTPKQRAELRAGLKEYERIQEQIHLLEKQKKETVSEIRKIRESLGVDSILFEGFRSTNVAGVQKSYDKKKALKDGVNLDDYLVYKPKKAYEKISIPGETPNEDSE